MAGDKGKAPQVARMEDWNPSLRGLRRFAELDRAGPDPQVAEIVDRNPCLSELRRLATLIEEVQVYNSQNPNSAGLDRFGTINPAVEFAEIKGTVNGGKGGRVPADKRSSVIKWEILWSGVQPEISAPCPPSHKTARKKRSAANSDSVVRKGAVGSPGSPPPVAKVDAVPEAAMGRVDGLGSPAPPMAKVRNIPKSAFLCADGPRTLPPLSKVRPIRKCRPVKTVIRV